MTPYVIPVKASRSYEVFTGSGLIADCGQLCRAVNGGRRALVVTDSNVMPLYADAATESLTAAGYDCRVFVFEAGEQSKTLETVNQIFTAAAALGLDRCDLMVALGGGVTGDMTGFAAATWMRGMDFIQIPTTLLAQVDSSVGGKTGVNIAAGKNLVGAFWQPRRVIADADTLRTLPAETVSDGMAEVIKTAAIRDAALFAALERSGSADAKAISRCVEIKRDIVERDEFESGERRLLNFGHTIGHALERFYGYGAQPMSHGRAVAAGMAAITAMSEECGITAKGTSERLNALLIRVGLPVSDAALTDNLEVRLDKKAGGNTLPLVVLDAVGCAHVHPAPVSVPISEWFLQLFT